MTYNKFALSHLLPYEVCWLDRTTVKKEVIEMAKTVKIRIRGTVRIRRR